MNFSITTNQPISDDIKKRIDSVRESITNFQILHESIFNDGISTIVSLDLGLPYYIQHVSSGKVITMLNDKNNNLILEDKPNVLTKFQEWNFKKSETNKDVDNLYTITSNKNNMCLSYGITSITSTHEIKMLNCTDKNSLWTIENQNDAYKVIKIYPSTKTLEYSPVNDYLIINNITTNLNSGGIDVFEKNQPTSDDNKTPTDEYSPQDFLNLNNLQSSIFNNQSWIIKPSISGIIQMRNDLTTEINNIKNLVGNILPSKDNYKSAMTSNANKLIQLMNTFEQSIVDLDNKRQHIIENNPEYDHEILEGKFQNSTLDTNTQFYKYSMYLIFAVFITISMIYIYLNPEETSLDMFMLAFALFILMYYIYDYFKRKL
jgi:hypothetical protein